MKKAIVVGASSGIGKKLAELLVIDGYFTGITGRRIELLNQIKTHQPDSYIVKEFDICNTEESIVKLNELIDELQGLDLLIISAGTGEINENLDFSIEKMTIETNVTGFTCIADCAFSFFEKQKSGHLVAISSVGGIRGSSSAPSYNASKAYQINYLEGLMQKAAKQKSGIYITDVRAGLVNTAMAKGNGLFWVTPVEKVAKQILKAVKQKKQVVYVTKRWGLIAFILKTIPRIIYKNL